MTDCKKHEVHFEAGGAKVYSPAFQSKEEFSAGWKSVLSKAHGQIGVIRCGCPGNGRKQLAVRYYEESDSFGLARYPMSGEEHSTDCRFYAPNPAKSGMHGCEKGVVEEGEHGTSKIRLEIGLRKQDAKERPQPRVKSYSTGTRRPQPAMRMLGLLHLLWEEAGLNLWWPAMQGKRNLWVVNSRLVEAASNITTSSIRLNKALLLGAPHGSSWEKYNEAKVEDAIKEKRRLLLVAPLAKFKSDRSMKTLAIAGFGGIPLLNVNADLWDRCSTRFTSAIAAWRNGDLVLAIANIDISSNRRFANVVDIALMQVTDNWIPVESSFEKKIADKLTLEKRSFSKPLRFDANTDAVFPDFILRDTGKDTPLEVFGRTDEDYEARKSVKTAYYDKHFGIDGWWKWCAAKDPQGSTIKPFPPVTRNLRNRA